MLLSFTAPVNIRFPPQSITNVSFVVWWDAVIQSVDRYIVSVHWTHDRYCTQSFTVHGTSYTVTGLTPNTTYTVTVTAVDEPNCNGLASVGKEVTTTVSVSMDTISTIDTPTSPSINPTAVTVTTDNSVCNNVINATIDSVPTLTVTIMSTTRSGSYHFNFSFRNYLCICNLFSYLLEFLQPQFVIIFSYQILC